MKNKKSDQLVHKNIRITGKVQGVGFRYSARSIAAAMGINGFVKNLPDGGVYIEAEGLLPDMEAFVQWCHEGPPRSIIRFVDVIDSELQGYSGFAIR